MMVRHLPILPAGVFRSSGGRESAPPSSRAQLYK
jgi:hypothetical protein